MYPTDSEHLKKQYANSANLENRITLHSKYSTNPLPWTTWVFKQMNLHGRILEIGCGSGLLWRENLRQVSPEWQIVLSDFSLGMLHDAGDALAARPFTFAQCSAEDIPFADAAFDVVIANHMLYHVPDVHRAVGEMRRVLKPNGVFYAATNGRRHMFELKKYIKQFLNVDWEMEEAITGFNLENGGQQLSIHFSDVSMEIHTNQLCVTEPQPLIDYILSINLLGVSQVSAEQTDTFRQTLSEEIQAKGAIWIQKASGLFMAQP
jgi:SAM-dependent methyltransferase